MFNDTPAQRLHWLLGVTQKRYLKVKYSSNILYIHKVIQTEKGKEENVFVVVLVYSAPTGSI